MDFERDGQNSERREMKTIFLVSAIWLLAGCATTAPTEGVSVSPKIQAACQAEGGCTLYTSKAVARALEEAFEAGYGAALEAAQQKGRAL
jgi:uncharacterized lipoprotein YajG